MPVPGGEITTSEILTPVTLEDATELLKSQGEFLEKLEEAIIAADAEEATEEYEAQAE
jgi:hypothetical protein